jgi:hypothetical protein
MSEKKTRKGKYAGLIVGDGKTIRVAESVYNRIADEAIRTHRSVRGQTEYMVEVFFAAMDREEASHGS